MVSKTTTEPCPFPYRHSKTPVTKTGVVVHVLAMRLLKPPCPAIARATNVTGSVSVQVLIDEAGNVVSAKAVDGHAFFKAEAERAARHAKFRPTTLSDQPVKVSGIIIYRFSK
jgi:protein TonB